MSAGGWVIMILSVGFVSSLLAWCIYRVVSTPGSTEHLRAPADISTPDIED